MEEEYVSLAEMKGLLEKEKAARGEVNQEQQYSPRHHLPQGHPDQSKFRREPLSFALGEDEFKLFELTPRDDASLSVGQKVYIGKDIELRKEILHVKRRVGYEELTTAAQSEIPYVVAEGVKAKEEKVVGFFNNA